MPIAFFVVVRHSRSDAEGATPHASTFSLDRKLLHTKQMAVRIADSRNFTVSTTIAAAW
jgi:hypothetical protein